jgi:hypothetical protein
MRRLGRVHDVIWFYAKGVPYTWNTLHVEHSDEYKESHYRYVEEETGRRYRKGDLTAARAGGDTGLSPRLR